MLIQALIGNYISFTRYPGRLVIMVDAGDDLECGVFSGSGGGFSREESEQRMPTIPGEPEDDSFGFRLFEISRVARDPRQTLNLTYYYKITQRSGGVYLQYLKTTELTLSEQHENGEVTWHVTFNGVALELPAFGVPRE